MDAGTGPLELAGRQVRGALSRRRRNRGQRHGQPQGHRRRHRRRGRRQGRRHRQHRSDRRRDRSRSAAASSGSTERRRAMPPAARVGDPTAHPGVVTGPGRAHRAHRRHARRDRRHPARLFLSAGTPPHPPSPIVPPGCPTVLIGGRPAARLGDLAGCGAPIVAGCPDRADRRLTMATDFVGAGWAFPLRTDATGGIALVRGDREIVESIRLILGTAPGERPDAARVRLRHPRARVRPGGRDAPPGRSPTRCAAGAGALGAAHRVWTTCAVDFDRRRPGAPSTSTSATGCAATTTRATSSSRSTSSRARARSATDGAARPEPRRPPLPGPRRRRQAPRAAPLPGVDRPQRLRPGRDADRDASRSWSTSCSTGSTGCPTGTT